MLTLLISAVYFFWRRSKLDLLYFFSSLAYLILIFGIYFPHFTQLGYQYQNSHGLLSDINLANFYNTSNKRQVFAVSLGWFGLLPFFSPLTLIPFLGDLFSYFVIGNNIAAADGLFMHYRVTLAPLLLWSTIFAIARFKWLNKSYIGVYLIVLLLFFQYSLHLPLSYLTKGWFWQQQPAVKNINKLITSLPPNASVVSQNNITPHLTHRHEIFTLWPDRKNFKTNSPCDKKSCNWLTWRAGQPQLLIVDTSSNWDIRHFLADRNQYIDGLTNMEKAGVIKKKEEIGNAVIYKIEYKKLASLSSKPL